jgi:hypothetical protein
VRGEDLDGDVAIELDVARQVDDAHAAAAELALRGSTRRREAAWTVSRNSRGRAGTITSSHRTPDGRFLRKVGRAGRGPGEYLQIREVCLLRGDSLLVIDFSIGTLTLLDRAGAQVRSFARPGYVPINGCRADGTVIVQRTPAESVVGSSGPVRLDYALIRPDGSDLSSLGAFERGSFAGPISFEPSVVPMGDGFLFADPRRGELQVRSATGRVQRIIRTRERRAGPSEAEWEQRVLGMLPRGSSEEQRKTLMTRIMPLRPASMPLFGRVRVDAAGRIWIQDAEARRMYMVLSPTGALLGQVEIPEGDLANFLPDQVVILYRDEDGTPYLRIHPLSVTR